MEIEVLGLDTINGKRDLGVHVYEFHSHGVTQYIGGEKRAEIDAENWEEFCKSCPEAELAQRRLEAKQAGE